MVSSDWGTVEKYLKKDNADSVKLAMFEAEKVFLKVLNKKGYKVKNLDEKISLATKEMTSPEVFLRSREKLIALRDQLGFDLGDPYSGIEVVNVYKGAVEDLLFGMIDGKKNQAFKMRIWPLYYFLFTNKKKIIRPVIYFIAIVLIMLFIADTEMGRNIFDYLIDKIHLIIRVILIIFVLVFLVLFFITLCIVALESRFKKRSDRLNR